MRRLVVVVLTAVLCPLVACSEDEPAAEPPGVPAYAMVIARFLPPALDPDDRPVMYVVPVNGESLALETQVGVIERLAEQADVRFVDDPAAALDEESSDQPPRDEGTLVGLGRFSAEPPYTIRVELYRGRDRIEGRLLTVRSEQDGWVVIDAEVVAPEVLVGDG